MTLQAHVCALLISGVVGISGAAEIPGLGAEAPFSGRSANNAGGGGWLPGLAPSVFGAGNWLDASRLTTSSSYSMSMQSGGGHLTSAGLFTHNLEYQLSTPWTVRLGLGVLHDPLALVGGSSGGAVLPDVQLLYRPSPNLTVSFRYQRGWSNGGTPMGLWSSGFGGFEGP
ncbi:MAG: hypothetical protein QGH20_03785 [Candidatus Latescibacteria bacterium]|jgi:outer membrane receptor protein involved in Fe transport|nr:hypothetical protein [Candidatus Latescibacterota bacterium]